MNHLSPPHPSAPRVEWKSFLDNVDEILAKSSITPEELGHLGLLWPRLTPALSAWRADLDRIEVGRRVRKPDGVYSEPDPELEKLYDRVAVMMGQLRSFASVALAGTPEFPATAHTERLANELVAAQIRERVKVAEDAEKAKPKTKRRWTPQGWIINE